MHDPNLTPSLVRTIVPMAVGALSAWTVNTLGIELPLDPATETLTAILSGLYYAAVRWLESRWPGAGVLLGARSKPHYERENTNADEEV